VYTQIEMKNLILFDIDDTLLNTELLKKLQPQTLANYLGISISNLTQTRTNYLNKLEKSSDFSINDYLKIVAKQHKKTLKELREVFLDKKNFRNCLYEDVQPVLKSLKKSGYKLGIFSEGFPEFQEHKLKVNKLEKFFDQQYLHILRRKLDNKMLSNLPNKTMIVDDKPVVIEKLKSFANIIPIQIVRENKKDNSIVCKKHISNLSELINLL
jgi:phosphoglycolate phosphatase-like HAD superfamily hydrolase